MEYTTNAAFKRIFIRHVLLKWTKIENWQLTTDNQRLISHIPHPAVSLLKIHHLTAICSNVERTAGFYTKILGLRLVKRTVDFDDPSVQHLFFGDESGKPGTLITFLEWPKSPSGHWGIGTTHHVAFVVESADAQLKWKRWLIDHAVGVNGPYDRTYFRSIYFADPDGLILEIATRGPGWAVDEYQDQLGVQQINPPIGLTRFGRNEEEIARLMWTERVESITADMTLEGLHHITAMSSDIGKTTEFLTELLGMKLVKRTVNYDDPTAAHYYFGAGNFEPGTIITYFGYSHKSMRQGSLGTGLTNHFAFAVENEDAQLEWREKLLLAGLQVTPVLDRVYFKSISFQDPDGHILEIATLGPGLLNDESPAA